MKIIKFLTFAFLMFGFLSEIDGQRVRIRTKSGNPTKNQVSNRSKSSLGTKTNSSNTFTSSTTKAPKFSAPTSTVDKLAKNIKVNGRAGRETRLRELASDPKLGRADKGWLKQEMIAKSQGNRSTIRVPPGKELAHKRGMEAAKGFSHAHSELQSKELHRIQHKYDNNGRKQTMKQTTP